MNPSRIVSAAAALAVGFGITLVGTTIADSDDDALVTVEEAPAADEPIDTADEADESGDDDAVQDVIEVPEPEEATTEEDLGDDDEFADEAEAEAEPTDDGDASDEPIATVPVEDAPSPVDTEPDTGRTPGSDDSTDESREPSEPGGSELPSGGSPEFDVFDCFNVIKLLDGTVLQEDVDYALIDGERELLPGAPAVNEFELRSGEVFSIEVGEDGVFFCDDGPLVDDDTIAEYGDAVACFAEVEAFFLSEVDPFGASPDLEFDLDVYVEVVATRLDDQFAGPSQIDGFVQLVESRVAGLRFPCSPTVVDIVFEAAFNGGLESADFFCAAANLAATDDLFIGLEGQVPLNDCEYDV